MKLSKKPAYQIPEYENEDEYDMKDRLDIDLDELKKRSELYDEEDSEQDGMSSKKPIQKPASSKYDNENEYDMKERLAIDAAERAERAKNYSGESYSKPKLTPRQQDILNRYEGRKSSGASVSDSERGRMKGLSSNLDISDDGDFIYDPRLSKEANAYLKTFSPAQASKSGMKPFGEDGMVLEGRDYDNYYRDLMDEQRRQIENKEISENEIKKFLRVRNLINQGKM
jgi:hypothetical protein